MANDVSFPIRISKEMKAAIDWAVKKTGLSQQDVSRLVMKIGLAKLKVINYDIEGSILEKADGASSEKFTLLDEAGMKKIFEDTHGLQDAPQPHERTQIEKRLHGPSSARKR